MQVLKTNWLALQQVFRGICCRGDDPFTISRQNFGSFLADCELLTERSAADVLFYQVREEEEEEEGGREGGEGSGGVGNIYHHPPCLPP